MRKFLLCICLPGLLLFSCKKDNNNNDGDGNPPPVIDNCRILKSTRANFSDKTYEYDAQKRLIKSKTGNTVRTFAYNNDNTYTVSISEDNGQTISSIRTITYNNDKMTTNVRIDYTGGHWENTSFEYEGTRVVKRIYTHPITSPSVTTYEWQNGNLIKEISSSGNVTSTYAYDTNKLYQGTDYFGAGFFDYGIRTVVTKNRVNKAITSSATYNITHYENQDGKVNGYKVDIEPGGDYTVNFTLACD